MLYAPFFMKIFQIGKIGNIGTKIIIEERYNELQKYFSNVFLDYSIEKINKTIDTNYKELLNDNNYLKKNEIIAYSHIGKGGFLAALYKFCEDFKKIDILKEKENRILTSNILGLNYYLLNTNILQCTIEISNFYNINPYRLYTDNAYIVFSNKNSIEGFNYIGETTNEKKRIRMDVDSNSFLTKDYKDELNKLLPNYKDYK